MEARIDGPKEEDLTALHSLLVLHGCSVEYGSITGCKGCGNLVACTCAIMKAHKPDCRFRRAAALPIEIACEHGFQACPECDPCSCGIDAEGVR